MLLSKRRETTPGSAGCRPAAFGRCAECLFTNSICPLGNRFAASCRELQGGSLRSTKISLRED
jgi:hypothetical protein